MASIDLDIAADLQQQVAAAYAHKTPLNIRAGNTKAFYGRAVAGEVLDVAAHVGIISYEPTELVLTARAGTPLRVIEAALAAQGQMLACEPPHLGAQATIGGTVACNLSGPRRAYAGSTRDFLLGCHVLNGKGERLHFGGEVMKNVAGYDASRLMCGALGTLGVLLDVSLKVLPVPSADMTMVLSVPDIDAALLQMNQLAGQAMPLSASAWVDGHLYLRYSGSVGTMDAIRQKQSGDVLENAAEFWRSVRELQHDYFASPRPLWRIAVPQVASQPDLAGDWLIEWGGAQRWLHTEVAADVVRAQVAALGGHATLFAGGDVNAAGSADIFQPLDAGIWRLHQRLKQAFDPANILNPGRMYEGL